MWGQGVFQRGIARDLPREERGQNRRLSPAALRCFARGRWWLLAGRQHGHEATECRRHLPAESPAGQGERQRCCASFAAGLGSGSGEPGALSHARAEARPLPPAGQDLWPGSVMRKEGDPPAPGAPGLLPVLAATSPPPCPSFPAVPSLLVPAGISRSFLPTRRCRFSFPALHPCLETVAWRQTPGSSMF